MAHILFTIGVLSLAMAATATTITAAPAATDIAGALATLLPTAPPSSTEDTTGPGAGGNSINTLASICQSDLLGVFFLHASPSGDLSSALQSFGSVLTSQACAAASTATPTGAASTACPSPAPSLWCAFPQVAPSSVLANYTSYGLAAASFLPWGLSPLVALATQCPQAWYGAKTMFPEGPDDLRDLAIFGECFATARDGAATGSGTATGAATATSGAGKVSASATGTATGASKSSSSSSGTGRSAVNSMTLSGVAVACLTFAMLL